MFVSGLPFARVLVAVAMMVSCASTPADELSNLRPLAPTEDAAQDIVLFKAHTSEPDGLIEEAEAAPSFSDEVKQLQKRLETLELEAEKDRDAVAKQAAKIKVLENPSKDIPADKWNVKLGGHVQLDYITWANADDAILDTENYFSYRRLRLVADGTGYEQFDFRLQLTLEPGQQTSTNFFASADVKDAYFSMNEIPGIGRARIGNFFVPFGLEQVTNDTMNTFTERSIPTEGIFTASREPGVAIYNCTTDKDITWTGGLFFDEISDTIKTRFNDNQGYRLSGRLTWLPFYDEPSDGRYLIFTGVGMLHTDDQDDLVRFRARPQIQRGPIIIDSGLLAADSYTTGNLEFAAVWGPLSIQSEAYLSGVATDSDNPPQFSGAYAYVSYFLTNENRIFEKFGQHGAQFARNKPRRNFKLGKAGAGPGAWEVKARWSNLDLEDVNRGKYNDLTVGFNWYWSDRTRWMFDWIHPVTTGNAIFGETKSDLLAMRFDFNW